MPSAIGAVNINSNSGQVNFGDALNFSPKSTAKEFFGAGSQNIGNFVNINSGVSSLNSADPHLVDQVQIGNV